MSFFSGLLNGMRRAIDPTRLAMTQALVEGDYGAAAAMAQRFRQLQEEHERVRRGNRRKGMPAAMVGPAAAMGEAPATTSWASGDPAVGLAGGAGFDDFAADGPDEMLFPLSASAGFEQGGRSGAPSGRRNRPAGAPPLRRATGQAAVGVSGPRPPIVQGIAADAVERVGNEAVNSGLIKPPMPQAPRRGINDFGYEPRPADVDVMARALYSEFGERGNWEDMIAGGWSIVNRIRPDGPWPRYRTQDTIAPTLVEALERRARDGTLQYSFMPPGGITGAGGSPEWQQSANPERLTDHNAEAWKMAVLAAKQVLGGLAEDPTGGSTYFHNESRGTPLTVGGFFGDAQSGVGGRPPTIAPSRYESPNGQNFFYDHLEDPLRPRSHKLRQSRYFRR